jgi:hypothetical protein
MTSSYNIQHKGIHIVQKEKKGVESGIYLNVLTSHTKIADNFRLFLRVLILLTANTGVSA